MSVLSTSLKVTGKSDPEAPGDFDNIILTPNYDEAGNAPDDRDVRVSMSVSKADAANFQLGDTWVHELRRSADES